jgi:hypothetical protein
LTPLAFLVVQVLRLKGRRHQLALVIQGVEVRGLAAIDSSSRSNAQQAKILGSLQLTLTGPAGHFHVLA